MAATTEPAASTAALNVMNAWGANHGSIRCGHDLQGGDFRACASFGPRYGR